MAIRYVRWFAAFVLLWLFEACQLTYVPYYVESVDLQIHKAQYHKEHPGVEDMEPYWSLKIQTAPHREKVQFDSIYFKGAWKVPVVRTDRGGSGLKIQVRESEVGTAYTMDIKVEDDQALIYYTYKERKLYKLVRNIKRTQTIYLP
jgi:hypothetical protein